MPPDVSRRLRFGPFEADSATGELSRDGRPIALQELPFRLLAALLERPGELVTREELRARLWPGDVHVDFEHGLNKAMNKIRVALGDDPDAPRYVETLPRRGYRLVSAVAAVGGRSRGTDRHPEARVLWEGRTIRLSAGENLVGRDAAAVVSIDSATVSRQHARIVVAADGALLEDLGSKNGTLLNGRRIARPETLRDGDEIAVGAARLGFRLGGGNASTQTATDRG